MRRKISDTQHSFPKKPVKKPVQPLFSNCALRVVPKIGYSWMLRYLRTLLYFEILTSFTLLQVAWPSRSVYRHILLFRSNSKQRRKNKRKQQAQ